MKRRYNLYYLFLEDRKANPIPQAAKKRIQRKLNKLLK